MELHPDEAKTVFETYQSMAGRIASAPHHGRLLMACVRDDGRFPNTVAATAELQKAIADIDYLVENLTKAIEAEVIPHLSK